MNSAVRRHRPAAAAAAYSLALSVTGDAQKAASIAATALRKGAGSRTAVIAHARKESLSAARPNPSALEVPVASTDLRELAHQLAASRPAIERAVVNLELRSSLDTGSFSRVLGLTSARATARSREIAEIWARALDPAVMAWLGPGSCESLAGLLRTQQVWPRSADAPVVSSVDSTGPIPILRTGTDGHIVQPLPVHEPAPAIDVRALLNVAPVVFDHAQDCEVCAERLRLLTPVRTLVGQLPLEELPPKVVDAARNARRRLPAPLPPSIERRRLDYTRLQVPAFGLIAVAVVVVLGFAVTRSLGDDDGPSQSDRVAQLVQNAPVSSLLGTPSIVTPGVETASLANNSNEVVTWRATSSADWLTLSPTSGRIQPSRSISIGVKAEPPASGATDATITITGDDGSVQTLKYDSEGG